MKRSGFLKRTTRLVVRKVLRRGKRLRRRGARAEREAPFLARFNAVVLADAEGRCRRCGSTRWRLTAHHMLRRSRGLSPAEKHDPKNGAALCAHRPGSCHDLVHDAAVPDWREWFR